MFTKEELDLIYHQMSYRKEHFENVMVHAGKDNNYKRVLELAKHIEMFDSILDKCLKPNTPTKKEYNINPLK